MIIFESTLTTFEASFIFWGRSGSIKNWLELKIKPLLADFGLPKSLKHTVWSYLLKNHGAEVSSAWYVELVEATFPIEEKKTIIYNSKQKYCLKIIKQINYYT
jgi:hypothetical protein